MKYFILFWVIVFLGSIIFFVFFQKSMKRQILKNNLTRLFETKTDSGYKFNLFLSLLIDLTADYILKLPKKERKIITDGLKNQSFDTLIKQSKAKEPVLSKIVENLCSKKTKRAKISTKDVQSNISKLLYCLWLDASFEYEKLQNIEQTLPPFLCSKKHRAVKNLIQTRVLFCKTDMKKASKKALKCLSYFQRRGLSDETAYTYIMLGQMHNAAQMPDAAHLFFNNASKIYEKSNNLYGAHFINLTKGVLFASNKQFSEAEQCFNTAENFYLKTKNFEELANILNQKIALYNLQSRFSDAIQQTKKALKYHNKNSKKPSRAFFFQEAAIAYYLSGAFKKALFYLEQAKKETGFLKDVESYAKILYLSVLIYQNMENEKALQKALTDLEKYVKFHHITFLDDNIKTLKNTAHV